MEKQKRHLKRKNAGRVSLAFGRLAAGEEMRGRSMFCFFSFLLRTLPVELYQTEVFQLIVLANTEIFAAKVWSRRSCLPLWMH